MARIAPYAEQHKAPQGPGDARPTATQIIEDQDIAASPLWEGRVVLITGCSPGGLGPETAKAIHLTGADVFITSRDLAKGKQVAEEVLADGKPGKVEVIQMDLGSLKSVQAAADDFLRRSGNKLHVLINNAGRLPRRPEGSWSAFPGRAYFPQESWLAPGVKPKMDSSCSWVQTTWVCSTRDHDSD